ncbi:MAG: S-methyl-5-thioribose-1-phosphate isomerase [Candidatus Zixiibacteriota bacterium]
MNFRTLEWKDGILLLLDQRRLPGVEVDVACRTAEETAEAIRNLTVRGAPAIGVAAAYGVALAANEAVRTGSDVLDAVRKAGAILKASRPTAVNLAWAVDRMLDLASESAGNGASLAAALTLEAVAIHNEDAEMCRKIGENGAPLLADGMTVLTHCNAGALATAGIGTALSVIYTAVAQGKRIKVYADETRPVLQGSRLTMWELMRQGIDATLITDNTAASVFAAGKIDAVIVGADRIAANGDVANKIGTYNVAILAAHHNVPFYVAAPRSTFDLSIPDGSHIPIEERSSLEVTDVGSAKLAPVNAKVFSPAFDVTPNEFITAIVSDGGVEAGGRGKIKGKSGFPLSRE